MIDQHIQSCNNKRIIIQFMPIQKYIGEMNMSSKKQCENCQDNKPLELFYRRHKYCIQCFNSIRRSRYKKSTCKQCFVEFRPEKQGRYKFCSEICRFKNKVVINAKTGCWIWVAHKNQRGYGTYVLYGWSKSGLAHRASYIIFKGEIPLNDCILHKCDTTDCVNPDHLYTGNALLNTKDMISRGRSNFKNKLTHGEVLRLRDLAHKGLTVDELCRIYNRSKGQIVDILKNRCFKLK